MYKQSILQYLDIKKLTLRMYISYISEENNFSIKRSNLEIVFKYFCLECFTHFNNIFSFIHEGKRIVAF